MSHIEDRSGAAERQRQLEEQRRRQEMQRQLERAAAEAKKTKTEAQRREETERRERRAWSPRDKFEGRVNAAAPQAATPLAYEAGEPSAAETQIQDAVQSVTCGDSNQADAIDLQLALHAHDPEWTASFFKELGPERAAAALWASPGSDATRQVFADLEETWDATEQARFYTAVGCPPGVSEAAWAEAAPQARYDTIAAWLQGEEIAVAGASSLQGSSPTPEELEELAGDTALEAVSSPTTAAQRLNESLSELDASDQDILMRSLIEIASGGDAELPGRFEAILRHAFGDMEPLSAALGRAYEQGVLTDDHVAETMDVAGFAHDGWVPPDPREVAALLYASGSEGLQEAVVRRALANAAQTAIPRSPDVEPIDTGSQNYYAAAMLGAEDPALASMVVEGLATNPMMMDDLYLMADNATINRLALAISTYEASGANDATVVATLDEKLFGGSEIRRVQGEIAQRQADLAAAGKDYDDSGVYDARTALPTVLDADNRATIEALAARYNIDPALLAGVVAAELDFDHDESDRVVDGLLRLLPIDVPFIRGPGPASAHLDTIEDAIAYLNNNDLPGAAAASNYDRSSRNRVSFEGSVEAAAIVLAMLVHMKGDPIDSAEDMAVVWGAYRNGAGAFEDFANNVATSSEDWPEPLQIGRNAYMSEPYFEYLAQQYGSFD